MGITGREKWDVVPKYWWEVGGRIGERWDEDTQNWWVDGHRNRLEMGGYPP